MKSQKTEHNTIEKENNAEKIYKIIEELMNYKNLLSEYDLKNDYEKYANLKTRYEAKKDEFLEMIKNSSFRRSGHLGQFLHGSVGKSLIGEKNGGSLQYCRLLFGHLSHYFSSFKKNRLSTQY